MLCEVLGCVNLLDLSNSSNFYDVESIVEFYCFIKDMVSQ